jgi:RNA polymerase sigma factor (sigma-70 family)
MNKATSEVIEEERRLILRVKSGEALAARELLEAHSGLMAKFARRYSRIPGYEYEDAMQQARIGCIDAAERFNLSRNVRFATYAGWRIRHHIKRHMQNTVGDIRTPCWRQDRPSHRVMRAVRLDAPLRRGDRDAPDTLLDLMPADAVPQDEQVDAGRVESRVKAIVPMLLRGLDQREILIVRENLCRHKADQVPLAVLGRRIGVSRERMRQVRDELVVKLRRRAKRLGAVELLAA